MDAELFQPACPRDRMVFANQVQIKAAWSRDRAIAALTGLAPAAIAAALSPKGKAHAAPMPATHPVLLPDLETSMMAGGVSSSVLTSGLPRAMPPMT